MGVITTPHKKIRFVLKCRKKKRKMVRKIEKKYLNLQCRLCQLGSIISHDFKCVYFNNIPNCGKICNFYGQIKYFFSRLSFK